MSPFWFAITALALYRVAYLIGVDNGPWGVCLGVRDWVAERWGLDSWQAEGIACPICISFWLAFVFTLLLPVQGVIEYALTSLALGGFTVVLHRGTR